ncbi:pullulanase [Streptococcus agalactiae 18RS21]|nr:pullulanase [Streptococcus agalactiae 18RS21]
MRLRLKLAYKEAKAINPNMIMIGEGWRTFQGDQGKPVKPADQRLDEVNRYSWRLFR